MRYWVTLSGYLIIVLLGLILWLYSRRNPNQIAPFGNLVDRLMQERNMRLVLVSIWWWLGLHFYTDPSLTSLVL
jgi:hypothetical protein